MRPCSTSPPFAPASPPSQRRLAFFDGPGGTQCPDEVIDAIAALPAPRQRERRRAVRDVAPHDGARRPRPREGGLVPRLLRRRGRVRAEHDRAQLPPHARARARARGRRRGARDAARPRRQRRAVARAAGGPRHRRRASSTCTTTSRSTTTTSRPSARRARASSRSPSPRTRSAPRPTSAASSSSPTSAGALAWADAVHYGPHGPIDVVGLGRRRAALLAVQVLRAAHGDGVRQRGAAARLAAVQGAAGRGRAGRPPLRARHLPARAARGLRRRGRLRRLDRLGGDLAHERALGQRFLDGLPGGVDLYGLPTMEGRVPTFCFNVPGRTSEEVAEHLATSTRSPSGGGTTTRSRRCAGSASTSGWAPCAPASSTTTPRRRSTGCSPGSRSSCE